MARRNRRPRRSATRRQSHNRRSGDRSSLCTPHLIRTFPTEHGRLRLTPARDRALPRPTRSTVSTRERTNSTVGIMAAAPPCVPSPKRRSRIAPSRPHRARAVSRPGTHPSGSSARRYSATSPLSRERRATSGSLHLALRHAPMHPFADPSVLRRMVRLARSTSTRSCPGSSWMVYRSRPVKTVAPLEAPTSTARACFTKARTYRAFAFAAAEYLPCLSTCASRTSAL